MKRLAWVPVCLGIAVTVPSAHAAVDFSRHHGVVQVAPGITHTCALMADHFVSCWGSGAAAHSFTPEPIAGISAAVKVVSGNNFSCALMLGSSVYCWGANDVAQLGDGTRIDRPVSPAPVKQGAADFAGVIDIAAGFAHVCALDIHHTVWCWGSNSAAQLGNYTVPNSTPHADFAQPIQVVFHGDTSSTPLQNVASISAGDAHTCAMFTNGEVDCWGLNSHRQLGNGVATTDIVDSPIPVLVPTASGWTEYAGLDVQAGGIHTCIRDPAEDGSFRVACWGDNESGQVGGRTGAETPTPIDVEWITTNPVAHAQNLASGTDFSCSFALLNGDSGESGIACWGANNYGQIGQSAGAKSPWPLNVSNAWGDLGSQVPELSAGGEHACALLADGTVWCWGRNVYAELGTRASDTDKNYLPVQAQVDAPIFTDVLDGD